MVGRLILAALAASLTFSAAAGASVVRSNAVMRVEWNDKNGGISSVVLSNDPYGMNWVEGSGTWGTIRAYSPQPDPVGLYAYYATPEMTFKGLSEEDGSVVSRYVGNGLVACVRRRLEERGLVESYEFTNVSRAPYYVLRGQLGILTTFNESYGPAAECETRRCHAHVFAQGTNAYVHALKMGPFGRELVLRMTAGALDGYSIRRVGEEYSNDRGDIVLHPASFELLPGESKAFVWRLDPIDAGSFVPPIRTQFETAFVGETFEICDADGVHKVSADSEGEVSVFGARLFVTRPFAELVDARVRFIVDHQQCQDERSPLYGALLPYDFDERRQYFDNRWPDHNASRERIGMGLLLARWLQTHSDSRVRMALDLYERFAFREFIDRDTGAVYDTIGKDPARLRLYNAPWAVAFLSELYMLKRDPGYLDVIELAMRDYYAKGGAKFYPDGCSFAQTIAMLREAGRDVGELTRCYRKHVENMVDNGIDYPPHEVKFEQAIVCPVVRFLAGYLLYIGEDARVRDELKRQVAMLTRFDGDQPDYRAGGMPIRHWDGYWFGKDHLYGDTVQYWSAASGSGYLMYSQVTGDGSWRTRAERCFRNLLCLYRPDGSASAAYYVPHSVTLLGRDGREISPPRRGEHFDAWANDQDLGLYFILASGLFAERKETVDETAAARSRSEAFARMTTNELERVKIDVIRGVCDLELVPPALDAHPDPSRFGFGKLDFAMNGGMTMTKGGRLWAVWVAGGDSTKAFTVGTWSDDGGKTWKDTRFRIGSSEPALRIGMSEVHRSGPISNIWYAPDGTLRLYVYQAMGVFNQRGVFYEFVCRNPDAAEPIWEKPRFGGFGSVHNKPIVLKDGSWLLPNDFEDMPWLDDNAFPELDALRGCGVMVSADGGCTWERRGYARPAGEGHYAEHSVVERPDGTLHMFMRTGRGLMGCLSSDGGRTWTPPTQPDGLRQPVARFSYIRLASGNLLFVKNGATAMEVGDTERTGRTKLTAFVSDDEGKTWKGGLLLDGREWVAYPDAFQASDGYIYVSYDHDRWSKGDEILFAKFTEEDVLAGKLVSKESSVMNRVFSAADRGNVMAGKNTASELDWRAFRREPKTPILEKPPASGFHGRVADVERIDAKNAVGDESCRMWKATCWRNERLHGQVVIWSAEGARNVHCSVSDLKGPDGVVIPSLSVTARFVRYVYASWKNRSPLVGDVLDDAECCDLPPGGFRPIWLTAKIPSSASPGQYKGSIVVSAAGGRRLVFPIALEVLPAALPDPEDWKFFLDIWQHPWAVARYHGVKPFSKEHYALMEPMWKELAAAGQKVITATIAELPWNHQNFDAYHSMVKHVKATDGGWRHDYSLFDEYVSFCLRCGFGQQIHCYTMCTWDNAVRWTDEATGDEVRVTLRPGTSEHEIFWGDFLRDFRKHLSEKGWLDRTYIALDERERDELKATADVITRYAPEIGLEMAGNKMPSEFRGIEIDNYSQYVEYITPDFLAEVRSTRRDAKYTSTFYVCCGPEKPNSFVDSPLHEQIWLGLFAPANGLDGFLRWAYVNWPRDPLHDAGFFNWYAGDTFLMYPGCRSSVRWEMLRDGVEEAEKIRILRARGLSGGRLEEALKRIDYGRVSGLGDETCRADVFKVLSAVEDAARRMPPTKEAVQWNLK